MYDFGGARCEQTKWIKMLETVKPNRVLYFCDITAPLFSSTSDASTSDAFEVSIDAFAALVKKQKVDMVVFTKKDIFDDVLGEEKQVVGSTMVGDVNGQDILEDLQNRFLELDPNLHFEILSCLDNERVNAIV